MATLSPEGRRRAVQKTLANWALEGFEPDAQFTALLDRYIDGTLTLDQVGEEIDAAFFCGNKKTAGD